MADRAGRAGLMRFAARSLADLADTVVVGPVVLGNRNLACVSLPSVKIRDLGLALLVREVLMASAAGPVFLDTILRAGRSNGLSLAHIMTGSRNLACISLPRVKISDFVLSLRIREFVVANRASPVLLDSVLSASRSNLLMVRRGKFAAERRMVCQSAAGSG